MYPLTVNPYNWTVGVVLPRLSPLRRPSFGFLLRLIFGLFPPLFLISMYPSFSLYHCGFHTLLGTTVSVTTPVVLFVPSVTLGPFLLLLNLKPKHSVKTHSVGFTFTDLPATSGRLQFPEICVVKSQFLNFY